MNAAEIAAIVGPITTLLAGMGGVWLTQRYQHRRDLRDAKRAAYIRWLQFSERFGTTFFKNDFDFANFTLELRDRMAELDLVASPKVRQAVQRWFAALGGPLQKGIDAQLRELKKEAGLRPLFRKGKREHDPMTLSVLFYEQIEPHREVVVRAMREDLDVNRWRLRFK